MVFPERDRATGLFPRIMAPDLLWTGGCVDVQYQDRTVHGHFSIYLVKGSEKTILVDTGHPMHWKRVERDVEAFLGERPLDYVFGTHAEFPHAGLLANWLRKYPDCIAVGDLRDYRFFYPDLAHRIAIKRPGDKLDLGDRQFVFLPAIWRDLNNTLWAFETKTRTLFVSDAFAYLHYHEAGQCDLATSEHPPPDLKMIQFFNERALQWTRFTDARVTFEDMDCLLAATRPMAIAGSHSGLIDTVADMVPLVKSGMSLVS